MKYPTLAKAHVMIAEEMGYDATVPDFDAKDFGNEQFPHGEIDIAAVEADLATLSAEDLETLCIGDQEEWAPVMAKLNNAEHAHAVLDAIFGV